MQIAFLRDLCDLDLQFTFAVCNRGGAKTLLTAYAACCILDNVDNFRITVISGSKYQASICYEYARDVFLETSMRKKIKGESTLSKTQFNNNNQMMILPASEKSTRAPRTDLIVVDEACEAKESILTSVLPQAITSATMKLVILTTPNNLIHIAKDWWDQAEELGIIRYHWDAFQCPWIPKKNIDNLKLIFDEATFDIEVMGKWVSKTGAVFDYADIQAALIDMDELPPMDKIDHFFLGIDWGDSHETVATIVGVRGDPAELNDKWFVYAVKGWSQKKISVIKAGIIELCEIYEPLVLSEHSGSSAFSNRDLRDELGELGIILKKGSFTGKKHRMVKNVKARLEHFRLKIPRPFKKTIAQLVKYHTKEDSEDFVKKQDDYVDSLVWANWGIHPAMGSIETLGEWEFF